MLSKGREGRILYIDLFAGPGRYEDESASTPILVLGQAIADPAIRAGLVSIFNDKDENNSQSLQKEIAALPGIETLKYPPRVHNGEVGEGIAKSLGEMTLVPTLSFIDPWGYKGLSLDLIGSVLKDWGSDCIFFFNYNRINMGLTNAQVENHVNGLLTKEKADTLRKEIKGVTPEERERAILGTLREALRERLGEFALTFRFKSKEGNRTSHYLVFVTKHFLGYEIMKGVMAKESTRSPQGVPTFEFDPTDLTNPKLLEIERPLDELKDLLHEEFAGETLPMRAIFERHGIGRRFLSTNYKDALRGLEEDGKIEADPPSAKRRKNTFADSVIVKFPK